MGNGRTPLRSRAPLHKVLTAVVDLFLARGADTGDARLAAGDHTWQQAVLRGRRSHAKIHLYHSDRTGYGCTSGALAHTGGRRAPSFSTRQGTRYDLQALPLVHATIGANNGPINHDSAPIHRRSCAIEGNDDATIRFCSLRLLSTAKASDML